MKMSVTHFRYLAIMLLMVASLPLSAQIPAGEGITLEAALMMAEENNPALQAAEYNREAADYERKAAIGLRMPKINVMGSYAYFNRDMEVDMNGLKTPVSNTVNQVIGGLGQAGIQLPAGVMDQLSGMMGQLMGANWGMTLQERNVAFVGGSVTVPLFTGGKINVANRAARLNLQTAEEQGAQSRNALVSELVERYYGLALSLAAVEVRQQVVDGVRVHLNDAIALEKNGIIARGERLYAEVKMAEAERDLQDAKLQFETLRSALANTLNSQADYLPVSAMFVLKDIESVDYFKSAALEHNPLLRQVETKRQLAEEGVKLHTADYMPQVALMGGGVFANYQLSNILPRWAVGVGVNITLFDGLSREHKRAAAKRTVGYVSSMQTKAQNDITVLVDKLYNNLCNYRDRIPSIESSMAFADEYLRIKTAAFREGLASSADVIDAQLNLAAIRIERMQAAFNYDVALAQLLEAAGLSDEFMSYARREGASQIVLKD